MIRYSALNTHVSKYKIEKENGEGCLESGMSKMQTSRISIDIDSGFRRIRMNLRINLNRNAKEQNQNEIKNFPSVRFWF